jgi:hypothetical protein
MGNGEHAEMHVDGPIPLPVRLVNERAAYAAVGRYAT